jgi:hypothetical protein
VTAYPDHRRDQPARGLRGLCGFHDLFYLSSECPYCEAGVPPNEPMGTIFGVRRHRSQPQADGDDGSLLTPRVV